MVHPLNELRKAREDGLAKARDPELAFITRAELTEALAPIRAALEVSEPAPDSGEPTGRLEPATDEESLESADSTKPALSGSDNKDGEALVAAIHERKSRAKRKPEGQDPLGLVPEGDED